MGYNPNIHHRRSIRLKGYDYSQTGLYFIPICCQNRACLFGEINDGKMILNDAGEMVQTVWNNLPNHYGHIKMDTFIIMPNHIHGIIALTNVVGAGLKPAPTTGKRHGLPEIVRALKTFSARHINEICKTPGTKIWQRNYWEHIIRNENEYQRITQYIINNPKKWEQDKLKGGLRNQVMESPATYTVGTNGRTPCTNNEEWMI
jgi:REP-associated tyrosine transposase